jgi:hypothetical protein
MSFNIPQILAIPTCPDTGFIYMRGSWQGELYDNCDSLIISRVLHLCHFHLVASFFIFLKSVSENEEWICDGYEQYYSGAYFLADILHLTYYE